jgi:hypothetical protein
MSPFHFIRRFQSVFGETPHQFRIRSRLDRAKYLLAVSDYSVTEVCLEVGFTSLGTFSDLFARRVGTAPSAYRRQVRALMPVPGVIPRQLIPGCLTLMGAAFAISEKQNPVPLSHSDPPPSRLLQKRQHEVKPRVKGQTVSLQAASLSARWSRHRSTEDP